MLPESSGSRTLPRLTLITLAPRFTAHLIARASAFGETVPSSSRTTFATSSRADGARPAIPAAVVDRSRDLAGHEGAVALDVRVRAADEALRATTRPCSSGCERSMPESITATRTGRSAESTLNASKARSWSTYHCLGQQRVVRAVGLRRHRGPERERDRTRGQNGRTGKARTASQVGVASERLKPPLHGRHRQRAGEADREPVAEGDPGAVAAGSQVDGRGERTLRVGRRARDGLPAGRAEPLDLNGRARHRRAGRARDRHRVSACGRAGRAAPRPRGRRCSGSRRSRAGSRS